VSTVRSNDTNDTGDLAPVRPTRRCAQLRSHRHTDRAHAPTGRDRCDPVRTERTQITLGRDRCGPHPGAPGHRVRGAWGTARSLAVRGGPGFGSECGLEHLAGGVAQQGRIDGSPVAGDLERCQMCVQELTELDGVERPAVPHAHGGGHLLSQAFVRHPVRGHLVHVRVFVDRRLHLGGIHVLPTAQHQVLGPGLDVERRAVAARRISRGR
jgi:hypothetical protein